MHASVGGAIYSLSLMCMPGTVWFTGFVSGALSANNDGCLDSLVNENTDVIIGSDKLRTKSAPSLPLPFFILHLLVLSFLPVCFVSM